MKKGSFQRNGQGKYRIGKDKLVKKEKKQIVNGTELNKKKPTQKMKKKE